MVVGGGYSRCWCGRGASAYCCCWLGPLSLPQPKMGRGGRHVLLLLAISPSLTPHQVVWGGGRVKCGELLHRSSPDQCTQHTDQCTQHTDQCTQHTNQCTQHKTNPILICNRHKFCQYHLTFKILIKNIKQHFKIF